MSTPRSRLLPPPIPSAYVARGDKWLTEVMERRVTSVVAGPGFGKSTLLARWAQQVPSAWYAVGPGDATAPRLAGGLADALPVDRRVADTVATAGDGDADADGLTTLLLEALDLGLDADLLLVVDDVHELPRTSSAARLLRGLVRQAPPFLHIALGSRVDLPFPLERMRGQGHVLTITAAELQFSVEEVGILLDAELDSCETTLASALHELTGGWPATVRLAVESLRNVAAEERGGVLRRASAPGGALYGYLAEEVLRNEPSKVQRFLERLAPLERFTPELCSFLELPEPRETLDMLARRGLFLDAHSAEDGWMRLHALVREAVLSRLADEQVREVRSAAAGWLESRGLFEEAIRTSLSAKDVDGAVRMLRDHGIVLIEHAAFDAVIDAAALLTDSVGDPEVEGIVADAYHCLGDDVSARRWLEKARARTHAPSPELRFRLGLVYPDRPREALAAWQPETVDAASPWGSMVLAYAAMAAADLGDVPSARDYASRAIAAARAGTLPRAQAELSLGMAAHEEGDIAEAGARFDAARITAEGCRALVIVMHAKVRLAEVALERGSFREALDLADEASSTTQHALFIAWLSVLRGRALLGLGQVEDALAELEMGRARYARLGYLTEASALCAIGEVHLERGAVALGRSAFERALALADQSYQRRLCVTALAGLARALAFEEPEQADRHAARALALSEKSGSRVVALQAAGWIALAAGRESAAAEVAREAVAEARRRAAPAGLACALELEGVAERSVPRLREAVALHQELGSVLGEHRAALAFAHVTGSEAGVQSAESRLRALGVQPHAAAGAAGLYAAIPQRDDERVAITTLGGFRLVRRGVPVPASEWQSRKARDLLKILVAHRGRPVPRELLMETLWPRDDPQLLPNRLSVVLSTVRTVLDPAHDFPTDHFVAAHAGAVSLDRSNVRVDVDRFLDLAEAGLSAARTTREVEAVSLLEAAEESYGGDFLEEDVYEDWAAPLREEARSVYLDVVRLLAATAQDVGELDRSLRYLQRLLERDPHDEEAHLALVTALRRAGRHGEARRRYLAYTERMEEIGVEPATLPEAEPVFA